MVQSGRATKDEADFMRVMKDRRGEFATVPIEEIKTYTALELRLLARMMADLRKGFDETGLHLRGWHGAGAAASALIENQGLKTHYGKDIAAIDICPQQEAAHHAYFGGRIELLKQGYMEGGGLHVYDIASAYPAAMVDFPSLASGEWINTRHNEIARGTLPELRAIVEAASCVSMFKIRYQFPAYEKYDPDARKAVFIPFYPLPYRDRRGGILFPASGYGWYMRDDVLAAIAWLERFVPDFPLPRKNANKQTAFVVEEAWTFEPQHGDRENVRPFAFIHDRFHDRKWIKDEIERTGNYSRKGDQAFDKLRLLQVGTIRRNARQGPPGRKPLLCGCHDRILSPKDYGGGAYRSALDRFFRDRWHRLDKSFPRPAACSQTRRRRRFGRLGILRSRRRSFRAARRLYLWQDHLRRDRRWDRKTRHENTRRRRQEIRRQGQSQPVAHRERARGLADPF